MEHVSILKKQMTRKEFVMFVIALLMAISGISRLLTTVHESLDQNKKKATTGYGSSPYGM